LYGQIHTAGGTGHGGAAAAGGRALFRAAGYVTTVPVTCTNHLDLAATCCGRQPELVSLSPRFGQNFVQQG
jgi:hypothetical protein